MRHPHGLRAAAEGGLVLPAIGSAYEGGFFAGAISHTANSVATHLLIVAPRGTGYNGQNKLQLKTDNSATAGTTNEFNGSVNSANMNDANHPAAQYCEGLSIGGYTDWYLPALYELDIAYQNLKPTTEANALFGINPYSVPARTVDRTSGAPTRTSVAAFQSGGAEAYAADSNDHWSSTQYNLNGARSWSIIFNDGYQNFSFKGNLFYVRAFRKVAV